MPSIQRVVSPLTGEVSYRAQVRVKGHEPQGKTFPNKKEAAAWATSIESAIREARYFPHQKASRTPFAVDCCPLATLSHLFTVAAKEWRLTDRNPVRDIAKKKESRGRVRFLSDEERHRLLDACAKSQWLPLKTLVLLAISTGARRSELINLKWADVDLKASRATVHDTKNGDPRVLPLVGKALEALRDMKLQGSAKSEYVFAQPSGFPGPYEHFDQHWYDALEAAAITDLRFHDLRHTTASYLAQQGASLLEIADTLGHRTMSMVKRYAHLAQSHKVKAIEKMAKERGL
jgi:integrase